MDTLSNPQHSLETMPASSRQPGNQLATLVTGGICLYILLDVIAQLLPPHYNPVSQPESFLAVGLYGWLMSINFVLRGIISFALLWGVWQHVAPPARSRSGLILTGVWALGSILLAMFPADLSFPPPTLHGILHIVIAFLSFVAIALGEWFISWHFSHDQRWQSLQPRAVIVALAVLITCGLTIATMILATSVMPVLGGVIGLIERIFLGLVLLWMLLVAWRLRSLGMQ